MASRTFDLSKFRDLDVKAVTARSVTGNDMLDASARCAPPDGGQIDQNIFVMLMRQQMVAQSIIGYVDAKGNSVTCVGPCLESVNWSARTREFLGEIFDHLNGVSQEERLDFRKSLTSIPGSDDTVSAQ